MLFKTMIALTAAVVLGSTSAAFAYEAPENKIGDRYPFLEQVYQPISANRLAAKDVMPRRIANLNQYADEVLEHKIGDRYPFLEQAYQLSSTSRSAGRYLADRYTIPSQVANLNQYANEVPEHKIGDRYPFLEPRIVSQRAPTRYVTARRTLTTGSIR